MFAVFSNTDQDLGATDWVGAMIRSAERSFMQLPSQYGVQSGPYLGGTLGILLSTGEEWRQFA